MPKKISFFIATFVTTFSLGAPGYAKEDCSAYLTDFKKYQTCLEQNDETYNFDPLIDSAADKIPEMVDGLLTDIGNADPETVDNTINILIGVGTEAIPGILDTLGEDDEQAKQYALQALQGMGEAAKEALPTLHNMLKDKDIWMRMFAAQTIEVIEPESTKVVGVLTTALSNSDPKVRGYAAFYLGEQGKEASSAVPKLRDLEANDPDAEVRAYATDALRKIVG